LVVAGAVFVISLLLRSSPQPTLPASPTTLPAPTASAGTSAPTTPPQPTAYNVSSVASSSNVDVVTYREALVGSVQRLNPLLAGLNPVDSDITALIFEGLTKSDQYGQPQPALAKSWVTSSDGLEYVVSLRDDVLWQDGIPFTAADVAFTMSLLRSPDFPGPSELGAFWRTVETEQLGDHLVRFRLAQPLGTFLNDLQIGILPVHALQGTSAKQLASHPFNLTPIGTGPYQLEALRSENGKIDQVDLRAAPVYRQRPEGKSGFALERLSFHLYDSFDAATQALQSGKVDGLAGRNRNERTPLLNTGLSIQTAIEPAVGFLIFNWAKDSTQFFRQQRVRVALEVGLNRAPIIERDLSNLAVRADSPLLPGSWAYSSDLPWAQYDPNQARELLNTANLGTTSSSGTATPSSTLFSVKILTPDDPALKAVAQEIATQWSQYNLDVWVDVADINTYQERLKAHDFDAALVELTLGSDPDVYAYWHQGQYPDGKNYGGADDRRISEDLERARSDVSSYNGVNRAVYYQKFQHDFAERAIALPLYYPLYTYALSPKVNGVQLGFIGKPADRFRNIQNWTIRS
jgi:peptide/nickel transport system substrate-binding protein